MSKLICGALSDEDKVFVRNFYDTLYACYGDIEAVNKFYKEHHESYDKIYTLIDYPYKIFANELYTIVTDDDRKPENLRVLDVGAGTGLLGDEMYAFGFQNMDALDMCDNMLKLAKKKDLYTNYFNVGIFYPQETPGIRRGTYDAAVCNGTFTDGHIKMNAILEMARMVKKGGYVMYTVNDPKFKMDVMGVQGNAMKTGVMEMLFMKKIPHKYDCYKNFQRTYCYLVAFKVL